MEKNIRNQMCIVRVKCDEKRSFVWGIDDSMTSGRMSWWLLPIHPVDQITRFTSYVLDILLMKVIQKYH